jgi:hypothetical protein
MAVPRLAGAQSQDVAMDRFATSMDCPNSAIE